MNKLKNVNALINDAESVHTRITITYDDVNDAYDGKAQALSTIVPSGVNGWSEDFAIRKINHSLSMDYLELAGFDFTTDVDLTEPINENNSLFTV